MTFLDQARTAIGNEDWAAAESSLRATLHSASSTEIYFLLGKACFKQGKFPAAEEALLAAQNLEPDSPPCLFLLAACALSTGRPANAASWLERYLQILPNDPKGWEQLGMARAAEKSPAAAFSAFARASELDPESESLLRLALRAAEQAGSWSDAIPVAERWLARVPQDRDRLRLLLRLQFLADQETQYRDTHERLLAAAGLAADARLLEQARVVTTETWELLANNWVQLHLPSEPAGKGARIRPSLTRHDRVRLLTPEWLALTASGDLLVEQMTHLPHTVHVKGPHVVALEKERCLLDLPRSAAMTIDDAAILVGGSADYYHWLVDHLPRIGIAHKVPALRDLKLLVADNLADWQWESLAALGIDRNLIMPVPDNALIQCRALWIPTQLSHNTFFHDYVAGWLRRKLLTTEMKARPARRLFIRPSANEALTLASSTELTECLAQLGFEIITPETMGFLDQVRAFAVAEIVVATPQPALTNLLFAPPKALVVEIRTPQSTKTYFKSIAKKQSLRHHILSTRSDTNGATQEAFVDIESLRHMILAQVESRV